MLRNLIQWKRPDVPVRVGLRNALGVALPLALGAASGQTGIGLGISAGALNTMFADQPGPYRLRMRRLFLTAAGAGVSAFVGYTLGHSDALTVLVALVWGFAGGLLVALGPDATRVGLTSMILLVITGADPRTPAQALGPALLIFAGGLLQMLLAIAAWPLQRYRPERRALAKVYRQLAGVARQRPDASQAPPITLALIDAQTLLHGRDRSRGETIESFRVLAEIAERIRVEVLALADLGEQLADRAARAGAGTVLAASATVLDGVADALETGASPDPASADAARLQAPLAALHDLHHVHTGTPTGSLLHIACARADGLGGQLRAAVRNADFAGSRGELRVADLESRLPRALQPRNPWAILYANLSLSSAACRHGLRCAICLAAAIAGARAANLPHGYWIPMTVAIVLKPDFAGTFSYGLLRVIGTLLGLVLTTALVHFTFAGVWERVILLAVLCFGFRQLTTAHYGIGVIFLTGLVVVLLSFYGEAPGDTMLARGVGTALGSAIALTAYALWPTWERGRVRPALAGMLDAYRGYCMALLDGNAHARADARSACRSTRTNAQASLDRLRAEPRRDPLLVDLAEGVFANGNRFVRAAMALEAILQDAASLPEHSRVQTFARHLDRSLAELVAALRTGSAMPVTDQLRPHQRVLANALAAVRGTDAERATAIALEHASDRLTDSVDALAHLLRESTAIVCNDHSASAGPAAAAPRGNR